MFKNLLRRLSLSSFFRTKQKQMIFELHTELDLVPLAEQVLAHGAKKIALYGQIGAGKTTFVKAFCGLLGTAETANSPTFSLVNEYEYANGLVFHLDLYRLETLEEALDIGIEDYLYSPDYCFIEWAEIIEPILPEGVLSLYFEVLPEGGRRVNLMR
jgi:tRNA threonylcarbamoyladenosine biosynthesis protein TsaE